MSILNFRFLSVVFGCLLLLIGCSDEVGFLTEEPPAIVWQAELDDSLIQQQGTEGQFIAVDNRLFHVFKGSGVVAEYNSKGEIITVVSPVDSGMAAGNWGTVFPLAKGLGIVDIQNSKILSFEFGDRCGFDFLSSIQDFHTNWLSQFCYNWRGNWHIPMVSLGAHPSNKEFYKNHRLITQISSEGKLLRRFGEYPIAYKGDSIFFANAGYYILGTRKGNIWIGFESIPILQKYDESGEFESSFSLPQPKEFKVWPLSDSHAEYMKVRAESWMWGPMITDNNGEQFYRLLMGPTFSENQVREPVWLVKFDTEEEKSKIYPIDNQVVCLVGIQPSGTVSLLHKEKNNGHYYLSGVNI